ncbi:MAG: hypothetical protein DBX05_03215 [Candidatus Poseidoniales archaeon]|nr:MAG: hypothetical protein DBX05_03215 [Candidatus Poseidoniales archaeon]
MRPLIPLALVMILISAATVSAASEGGVNKSVDEFADTGIDNVDSPSVFSQVEDFVISVNINESSDAVKIYATTQICVNSGLCYPPEQIEMVTEDNTTWTTTVSPMTDQTYVNWNIILENASENQTKIPETGFGWKVWSDCWNDGTGWGGEGYEGGESCNDSNSVPPPEGTVPTVGIAAVISVFVMAAIIRRD